jgi:hypothetical protein
MKAKFIYEKFEENSDPIHDLGIGGIVLNDEFQIMYRKFYNEWKKYLTNIQFIGKKIKGEFKKNNLCKPFETYMFIVKDI